MQWLVRLFGVLKRDTSIKIEKHGALAFSGRHSVATHNNQPIVNGSGRDREDVGEEMRGGKSVW